MSTIAHEVEVPELSYASDWLPSPEALYRMSVEKYEAMVTSGVFSKQDRFEVINPFLVTKMSDYPAHAIASIRLVEAVPRLLPDGFHLRPDRPLKIPNRLSIPETDLALTRGGIQDYSEAHPESKNVFLVSEVSDSSLRDDRTVMAKIYAAGKIPVHWIVNLVDRRIEVHRHPVDGEYTGRQIFGAGTSVPVIIDGGAAGRIAVDDVLPRQRGEG